MTREEAIKELELIAKVTMWNDRREAVEIAIEALSAEVPKSDDLIIKGAKGIQDGLYQINDGELFKYKAKGGTVRTYPIVPSAENTNQETQKSNQEIQKSNGDLIYRADAIEAIFKVGHEHVEEKVIPLGAVTDYSDAIKALPSAEAVQGFRGGKIPPKEMLDGTVLIPKHQWIEMERELANLKQEFESAEAEQGEWYNRDSDGAWVTVDFAYC